jgi:KDO2-lipid IV(A) lauroyltransferase
VGCRRKDTAISIRYLLEYIVVRLLAAFLLSLGPARAVIVGRRVGDLVRLLDRRHRKVAEENVRMALPELTPEQRAEVVRASFQGAVLIGVELIYARRCLSRTSIHRRFRIEDEERLREALGNRGAILTGGHLGNWEAIGVSFAYLGFPVHAIARRINNPFIDRYIQRLRTVHGLRVVPKYGALKPIVAVIRQGQCLGILIDQDVRSHGIFAEFFGRQASTIPTPATLALRLRVPLIVGCCVRTEDEPMTFQLSWQGPIEVDPENDRDAEVHRLTSELNRRLEGFVREHPGQYFWQHRRWKSKPPAEGADVPRPARRRRA